MFWITAPSSSGALDTAITAKTERHSASLTPPWPHITQSGSAHAPGPASGSQLAFRSSRFMALWYEASTSLVVRYMFEKAPSSGVGTMEKGSVETTMAWPERFTASAKAK